MIGDKIKFIAKLGDRKLSIAESFTATKTSPILVAHKLALSNPKVPLT
jgi:hypothetical protein